MLFEKNIITKGITMNRLIFIFGAGMRAKELKSFLALDSKEVYGFIVDSEYKSTDCFDGNILLSTEEFIEKYKPEDVLLYMGVGMPRMNMKREKIFESFHKHGYIFEKYISPKANVFSNQIGEGCTVFPGVNIGFGVKIGTGNHFEMGTTVSHDCIIGDYNFFAPGCTLCGNIQINKGCFLGANCTIANSIIVSDYTLVGAGAFVPESTKPYDVVLPSKSMYLEEKTSLDFMK